MTVGEWIASPEERLLRLIRGKPPAAQPLPSTLTPSVARTARVARPPRERSRLLPALNAVLGCLLVLFLAAIVWRLRQPVSVPAAGASASPVALPAPPAAPPALDTAPLQQRQLFQPPLAGADTPAASSSGAQQQAAQSALAPLTLVGIVDGTPPQAIIADATTQKSYFVTAGETFGAGFEVERIGEDRVTLRYQGASVELHL